MVSLSRAICRISVQHWSTTITRLGEDFRLLQQERETLLIARLQIAQGEAATALRSLDFWEARAHTRQRSRREIEILILKALAHFALSSSKENRDAANNHLLQGKQALVSALRLAQSEGYQRIFLDEGQPVAAALRAVLPDVREEPLTSYLRMLLSSFNNHQHADKAISLLPSGAGRSRLWMRGQYVLPRVSLFPHGPNHPMERQFAETYLPSFEKFNWEMATLAISR